MLYFMQTKKKNNTPGDVFFWYILYVYILFSNIFKNFQSNYVVYI